MAMKTHFITTEIVVPTHPIALRQAIETELEKVGKPLRWAITGVDHDRKTATIEAIVTTEAAMSPPKL